MRDHRNIDGNTSYRSPQFSHGEDKEMDSASMALRFEFENDSLAARKKVGRELKPEYVISTID